MVESSIELLREDRGALGPLEFFSGDKYSRLQFLKFSFLIPPLTL
jgi:hypothetical protein